MLYTDVLYKLAPSSIIALLNRSLAYTCLKLPELAVVDAYRAGILANQMRDDANNGLAKYQSTTNYLRAEMLHVGANELWTRSRRRFIHATWAHSPLSSIVINDIPELEDSKETKHEPFSISKRQVMCLALQVRAVYRLCGALYLCGGGARSDALGLIEDAITHCQGMENWEVPYFQALGNLILAEVSVPWDDGLSNDFQDLISVSKAMRRKQEWEKHKTKIAMRAKTTSLELANYDYDVYEPELDKIDWQKLLQSWVSKASRNCSPHYAQPSEVLDEIGSTYAELRADRDIKIGELVLSEQTAANVSTNIPEDVFEGRFLPQRHFFCDTCSSLLIVPFECAVKYSGTKVPPWTPSPPSKSSVSPERSIKSPDPRAAAHWSGGESPEKDAPIFPQHDNVGKGSRAGSQSPACPRSHEPRTQLKSDVGSDLKFCCPTHCVPSCSVACCKLREPFDPGLCHTSIECELRNSHLCDHSSPVNLDGRRRECLVDLHLVRIFARTFSTRGQPLQDSDIVLATCGPNHQGYANKKSKWSFLTHVIRPIHYIDQLLQQSASDQFDYLDKCDGWLINTLISKIDTAMRVSRVPRYAKVFNEDANLVNAFTPFDQEWADTVRTESTRRENQAEPWKDNDPWVASIHPIFNLIRVADPAKGEKPNVMVVQREGVKCYAFSSNGMEPAIQRGEPLLRAADDGEGIKMVETMKLGKAMGALLCGLGADGSAPVNGTSGCEGITQAEDDCQNGEDEAVPTTDDSRQGPRAEDDEANAIMEN